MAAGFHISIDLSGIIPLGAPITASSLPRLSRAVQAVAEQAQTRWVAYASGAPLPDGKIIQNRTGEYQRSILLRQTGDFAAEVYSNLPYAEAIETGTKARDLKVMLSSSMKVRVTHDGRRYMIIPFRWNVPNTVSSSNVMPEAVHNWWKGVPKSGSSAITGTYRRVSGTGAMDIKTRTPSTVKGWRYSWGTRATHDDLAGLGISGKAADRMAGMVRFRAQGLGKAASSKYMTFRVMTENSPGWKVPAQPGKYPARTVALQMQPLAEQAFQAAVEADIKALLGQG